MLTEDPYANIEGPYANSEGHILLAVKATVFC